MLIIWFRKLHISTLEPSLNLKLQIVRVYHLLKAKVFFFLFYKRVGPVISNYFAPILEWSVLSGVFLWSSRIWLLSVHYFYMWFAVSSSASIRSNYITVDFSFFGCLPWFWRLIYTCSFIWSRASRPIFFLICLLVFTPFRIGSSR